MSIRVPLQFGADDKVVHRNIDKLMLTGQFVDKPKQAQAIAYKQAGRSGRRARRR